MTKSVTLQKTLAVLSILLSLNFVSSATLHPLGRRESIISDNESAKVTICGNRQDDEQRIKLINGTLYPPHPARGKGITLTLVLDMFEEITSGEAMVSLNYEGTPILSESLDICEVVALASNEFCPLQKGRLKLSGSTNIPQYAPMGEFTGKIILTDQNGKEVLCGEAELRLK